MIHSILQIPQNHIRVLIADDDLVVRNALKFLFLVFDGLELVGEAGNGLEAIKLCAQLHPDVVLMDSQMPSLDGISATRVIHQQNSEIQIIILTSFGEVERVTEALEAGASNYLRKNIMAKELVDAIRAAYANRPAPAATVN